MEESAKIKFFRDELNLLRHAGSNVFAAADIFPYLWVTHSESYLIETISAIKKGCNDCSPGGVKAHP
jgi:hypothetical protein